MRITLLVVGRAKAPFTEPDAHYRKLLSRRQPIDLIEVRNDAEMVRRLPDDARLVALDREGRLLDSIGWSRWLSQRRLDARDVCLLVGGPKGLPAAALERSDERISLGPQTMAHQLARVVLLEQIFRAVKILAGEPYHY